MITFLPAWLLGSISVFLLIANTVLWCIPFYIVGIGKISVPTGWWRRQCARLLMWFTEGWISCNSFLLDLLHRIQWDVRGTENLCHGHWYLVACNHQTWADIPILQRTFNRRIPCLKFFLKRELIWVPLLGPAWWFLDYPFMKRYSREMLERHPELRGQDFETTRKACERFRHTPVSILNFLEGTRFTSEKHNFQNSPYMKLLRPKTGGMAFTLDAMGDKIRSLLDVTIVYPDGAPTFWDFLAGRLDRVIVHIEEKPIPAELVGGDYLGDAAFRARFQDWVHELWCRKDETIQHLQAQGSGLATMSRIAS